MTRSAYNARYFEAYNPSFNTWSIPKVFEEYDSFTYKQFDDGSFFFLIATKDARTALLEIELHPEQYKKELNNLYGSELAQFKIDLAIAEKDKKPYLIYFSE